MKQIKIHQMSRVQIEQEVNLIYSFFRILEFFVLFSIFIHWFVIIFHLDIDYYWLYYYA